MQMTAVPTNAHWSVSADGIYCRTPAGDTALAQPVLLLQFNLRRALALVDGRSNSAQLLERYGDEEVGRYALSELLRLEFIYLESGTPRYFPESSAPFDPNFQGLDLDRSAIVEEISMPEAEALTDADFTRSPYQTYPDSESAPTPTGVMARVYRPYARFALSWPLRLLVGFFAVLLSAVLGFWFFPYTEYTPLLEQTLRAYLQHPVHIREMHVLLLPKPKLVLEQVSLGHDQELTVETVKITPSLASFFKDGEWPVAVSLEGVNAQPARLASLLGSFPSSPPVTGAMSLKDWRLNQIGANILVDGQDIKSVYLFNEEESLSVNLVSLPDVRKWLVFVRGQDWMAGAQLFRSLDGKGELSNVGLNMQHLEGALVSGAFRGNLVVRWTPTLPMTGDLLLTHMDTSQVLGVLGVELPVKGDLSGSVRLLGSGVDWSRDGELPFMDGDFRIQRGQLERFDFPMAARSGGGTWSRGGSTHFDEFSLSLRREDQAWQLGGIHLVAGNLMVQGNAQVGEDGNLGGMLYVKLSERMRAPVQLSGTLKEPQMRLGGGPPN